MVCVPACVRVCVYVSARVYVTKGVSPRELVSMCDASRKFALFLQLLFAKLWLLRMF